MDEKYFLSILPFFYASCSAGTLIFMRMGIRKDSASEQIDQNCGKNCGIPGNASNKSTTKYTNISDIESILKSIDWFAR